MLLNCCGGAFPKLNNTKYQVDAVERSELQVVGGIHQKRASERREDVLIDRCRGSLFASDHCATLLELNKLEPLINGHDFNFTRNLREDSKVYFSLALLCVQNEFQRGLGINFYKHTQQVCQGNKFIPLVIFKLILRVKLII